MTALSLFIIIERAARIGRNVPAFPPGKIQKFYRGVAKFGIALGSGPRGLGFKSPHSDHYKKTADFCSAVFCYIRINAVFSS